MPIDLPHHRRLCVRRLCVRRLCVRRADGLRWARADRPWPVARRGFLLAALVCSLVACGDGEEAARLSFLHDGDRWSSTTVSAGIDTLVETDGRAEHSFRLVASNITTGEQITFWGLADEIVGTHPVRVFGRLADFGGVAPSPITNACSSNDPAVASGTLSIEAHDPERRLLSGSFIANVCAVGEPDTTATLGDGRFVAVEY